MNGSTPGAVLITGAARRIGRAVALALAADGWAVAVHCFDSGDDGEALVSAIRGGGGTAELVLADLADDSAVAGLVGEAAERVGPLTCLVNNASIFEEDRLATLTPESFDQHMTVNLRAPVFLSQAFAHQLPAGADGNIVNIVDQRVWNLTPFFTSYTLSKAGLWDLTQIAAMALAPHIRVNAIGPGPTLPSPRQTEDQFRRQYEALPLARPVDPEEIAAAVRFILATPSMTGQMMALDAGQHLGWAHPGADRPEE